MLQDSLAAEIEGTMRKELSLDDPECEEQKYVWFDVIQGHIVCFWSINKQQVEYKLKAFFFFCRIHQKRVFETVKNVNQTVRQHSLTPTSANIPGSNQSLSARTSPQSSGLSTPHSTMYGGSISGDNVALDNRAQSILMETASNQER